ncbi:MAG: hypothetical protein RLN85_20070 [Pseudomonadales bacterium]
MKKKDTAKIVRKLEDVILEHRTYFASWRSTRWSEFDKAISEREATKDKKRSK